MKNGGNMITLIMFNNDFRTFLLIAMNISPFQINHFSHKDSGQQ